MKKFMFLSLLLMCAAALLAGTAGCAFHSVGDSGYLELNGKEFLTLQEYARGMLWKTAKNPRFERRNGKVQSMLLQGDSAAEYVRTATPNRKIVYMGDLYGKITFEWFHNGWSYRVHGFGNLAESPEKIAWSISVNRPPDPEKMGDKAALWLGDDPQLEYRNKAGSLEFDLDEGVEVEGAELRDTNATP